MNNDKKKKRNRKYKKKQTLNLNIRSIQDILDLHNNLNYEKNYYFNKNILKSIIPTLEKINALIGMKELKKSIFQQVIFTLQNLNSIDDNFNTIIYGSPGTGKTTISLLLAELYFHIGLVRSPNIYNINKNDLVGQFCGSTVQKTQELLDKVDKEGAVLFIDEVYCLGFGDKTDLFSKECIDVICKNLLLKKNMITIISGYKKDIEENFLNINKGLDRRFTYKFEIGTYSKKDLFLILISKLKELDIPTDFNGISPSILTNVTLVNNAGDIDILVQFTKIAFANRVFGKFNRNTSKITTVDIINAISNFNNNKEEKLFFDYII